MIKEYEKTGEEWKASCNSYKETLCPVFYALCECEYCGKIFGKEYRSKENFEYKLNERDMNNKRLMREETPCNECMKKMTEERKKSEEERRREKEKCRYCNEHGERYEVKDKYGNYLGRSNYACPAHKGKAIKDMIDNMYIE